MSRGVPLSPRGLVMDVSDNFTITFDGIEHVLEFADAGEMEHAYAITVHKAQGSQFERVVVPVFPSRLLDRTLLYTAITRAEKQVVLIGDRVAFEDAVRALPSSFLRETGMAEQLRQLQPEVETDKDLLYADRSVCRVEGDLIPPDVKQ